MSHVAISPFAACSLALALGCATVDPIHRPPTRAEIDHVNASAGPVVVEFLLPNPSFTIDHVVSADVTKIVVSPDDGRPFALRLDDVSGFRTNSAGGGAARGAAWGAGIGASLGLGAAAIVWLGRHGDPNPPPCSECGAGEVKVFSEFVVIAAAVGAATGFIVGSHHSFPLSLGPEPSCQATPAGQRTARVVAPAAEVHSAPVRVAPIVELLGQGQSVSVDATPNIGWRFATLWDCRTGYVLDTQVKVDAL
jgi:hypothetical protein